MAASAVWEFVVELNPSGHGLTFEKRNEKDEEKWEMKKQEGAGEGESLKQPQKKGKKWGDFSIFG